MDEYYQNYSFLSKNYSKRVRFLNGWSRSPGADSLYYRSPRFPFSYSDYPSLVQSKSPGYIWAVFGVTVGVVAAIVFSFVCNLLFVQWYY